VGVAGLVQAAAKQLLEGVGTAAGNLLEAKS
jgi:hypothetical protein